MKYSNKAFTLIEILVTIGIIGLLLLAAVPSFNKYSRSNEFYQVAQTLKSAIETTKNYALAPRVEKEPGIDIYGILIEKTSDGFKYTIYEGEPSVIIENRKITSDTLNILSPVGNKVDIQFSISEKAKIIKPNIDEVKMQLINPNVVPPNNMLDIVVIKDSGRVEVNESAKSRK